MSEKNQSILTGHTPHPLDPLTMLRWVQTNHGISAARQLWEIARLGRGKRHLPPVDYYSRGLYRRSMSWEQKAEYIGERSNHTFNHSLAPDGLSTHWALINDKMLSGFVLQGMGIPTSKTLMLYGTGPRYGNFPHIATVDGLIAALSDPPDVGLFGKPVDGSLGVGAVSINRYLGAGKVQLLDGSEVEVSLLANEIARKFPQGYLLQERLQLHPDLAALLGSAVVTVRICSIHPESGPEVLYACLKVPAENAPIDGGTEISATGAALLDPASGEVLRAVRGIFPHNSLIEMAPTGAGPLLGITLPFFQEARNLVISAHRAFPDHGILGWDVVLTPNGPLINEVNANTHHMFWQRAADRGFLNPEHEARLAPVHALVAAKLAAKKLKKA